MVMPDWWVDGHCIAAWTADEARAEVRRLYNHEAETVRPWDEDDDEGMTD